MFAKLLTTASLAALMMACGRIDDPGLLDTPRSTLPEGLAGRWFTGTLSTIQYYDRNTGEFHDPSGSGFYYVFDQRGSYETGAVIDSTVAGCTMRLLGREIGTVTLDAQRLTRHRAFVRTQVSNDCGHSAVSERGAAVEEMEWSVDVDEQSGQETLTITDPEFGASRYRRWTE